MNSAHLEYHLERTVSRLLKNPEFMRSVGDSILQSVGTGESALPQIMHRVRQAMYQDFMQSYSDNTVALQIKTLDTNILDVFLYHFRDEPERCHKMRKMLKAEMGVYQILDSRVMSGQQMVYHTELMLMEDSQTLCCRTQYTESVTCEVFKKILAAHHICELPQQTYTQKPLVVFQDLYELGYYKFFQNEKKISFEQLFEQLSQKQFRPTDVCGLLKVG